MTQKAIIDTATRVIKRLTTDDVPSFNSVTETVIALALPITLTGVTVLGTDNVTLTPATTQQIQQAGLDEAFNIQQEQLNYQTFKTNLQTAIKDQATSPSLKAFLQAMDKIF